VIGSRSTTFDNTSQIGKGGGLGECRDLLVESGRAWASSSVVEQGTFNPRVVGSIPTWLTYSSAAKTIPHFRDDLLNSRLRNW
jgi:hypothetical protein